MKLIRLPAAVLVSVLAVHGFQLPDIENFAGSKVSVGLTNGDQLAGRLGHVSSGSVLLQPLKTGQGAATLAVKDIRTIRRLGFRDSKPGKFIVNAPATLIEYPIGALFLGMLCVDRLITGRWPEGP